MDRRQLKPNIVTFNSLLTLYSRCNPPRIAAAERLVEEVMRSRHVSPDGVFFSSLLSCYYRSRDRRDWERGVEVFRGIEQRHRSERVYTGGIELLGKTGREEEAMEVYLEAKERCRRWPDPFIEKEARRATGRLWDGDRGERKERERKLRLRDTEG
jgi:hypothetical protein